MAEQAQQSTISREVNSLCSDVPVSQNAFCGFSYRSNVKPCVLGQNMLWRHLLTGIKPSKVTA